MQVDLTTISNIQQLKAMKCDQYDKVAQGQQEIQVAQDNLQALHARITQIQNQPELDNTTDSLDS